MSVMVALVAILIAALAVSTYLGTSTKTIDGREEIVAWGITFLGEDVYALAHDFERQNPQYRVIISSTAERDTTSDSQRLLSAIAGACLNPCPLRPPTNQRRPSPGTGPIRNV